MIRRETDLAFLRKDVNIELMGRALEIEHNGRVGAVWNPSAIAFADGFSDQGGKNGPAIDEKVLVGPI